MSRSYSELVRLQTFAERVDYLKVGGSVGIETFGGSRYLNQSFYQSPEWQTVRRFVIARDNGCDLGIPDHIIRGHVYVHHINPATVEMVLNDDRCLLDPDNLISVSKPTHDYIHYGREVFDRDPYEYIERTANDMALWRK